MKQDVNIPARPPRKRRQLEAALDVWIAVWLDGELSPSERRRVEGEKQRRKEERQRDEPIRLVVLGAVEGFTPEQRRLLRDKKAEAEVFMTWRSGFGTRTYQEVVKEGNFVVAAPKEMAKPERPPEGSVWAAVRYAKDRKLPVEVIMPDGQLLREASDG